MVGEYRQPSATICERRPGGMTATLCNFGSAAEPDWYEFRPFPKMKPPGSSQFRPFPVDNFGVRRILAASRLDAAIGMHFLPRVVYCQDRKGDLGIGEACVSGIPYTTWNADPSKKGRVDRRDVTDCACFLFLLGYANGMSRIKVRTLADNPVIKADASPPLLRIYADHLSEAFKGYGGEHPVLRNGRGKGFTIATLSAQMREKLLAISESDLRRAVGGLIGEGTLEVTLLTLLELQSGIQALAPPAKPGKADSKRAEGSTSSDSIDKKLHHVLVPEESRTTH